MIHDHKSYNDTRLRKSLFLFQKLTFTQILYEILKMSYRPDEILS